MNGRGGRVGMGKRIKRAFYLALIRKGMHRPYSHYFSKTEMHLIYFSIGGIIVIASRHAPVQLFSRRSKGRRNRVQMAPLNRRSNEEAI